MMKLLNGQCAFCGRLKLKRVEVNRLVCKLRLLKAGLVDKAKVIDEITTTRLPSLRKDTDAGFHDQDDNDTDNGEEEENPAELMEKRSDFVEDCLAQAANDDDGTASSLGEKSQGIGEQRKALIREFFSSVARSVKCAQCDARSRSYRKDQFRKIFRKPLPQKFEESNDRRGLHRINYLLQLHEAKQKAHKEKQEKLEDRAVDEGIVADIDSPTDVEEDPELAQIDHEIAEDNAKKHAQKAAQDYCSPSEIYATLETLFKKEQEILALVYSVNAGPMDKQLTRMTPDLFFLRYLLVPPNKFRPEAKASGQVTEAQQNSLYKKILGQCDTMNLIRQEMKGEVEQDSRNRDYGHFLNAWVNLQDAVNSLIDSDRNPLAGRGNIIVDEGIKQKLEKKEGLFRKNMMGKRVNFAARSVISPDPNIETNEIGIPPVFARKLTYPEPVTNHSFDHLKQAVLNGPTKHPGAAAIESENGQVVNLRHKSFDERQALANQLLAPSGTNVRGAKNKKVHRHLVNGDMVIMNRQPTLHKPSMMCHKARVLPGEKTIRMHYANCNTYNADFDGDEMNMHFPQNENARAEAMMFADTDHQYLVATAGKPLRGLIQDHISMGVWLTNRDTMFTRDEYYQLLYSCMRPEDGHTFSGRIETVCPAILKPRLMWTGKQVVTTILKNITPDGVPGLTITGSSSTPKDKWGPDSEEGQVMFQSGQFICGIMDKAQIGPSAGGMVHSVYEAYGATAAGKLLSILGRLLTKLLHMRAFSCGMEDITLTESGDAARIEKLKEADKLGLDIASKYVSLDSVKSADHPELLTRLEEALRDEQKQAGLDNVYKSGNSELSSELPKACMINGLVKPYPKNQMQLMTTSGAKGSSVQPNLISVNLGQQVLEGRRVPVMVSGKTLPSFKPFETNVRAGGYITDRYLTGVRPQAYFFHSMAGREGLIDTAVKTSRSGYLQRCIIKGMEGLKIEYDSSVRDTDGSMVQFLYGEDGLEITKQKNLTEFDFIVRNFHAISNQLNIREVYKKLSGTDESKKRNAKISKLQKRIFKMIKSGDTPDPVLSLHNPGSTLGSTSEAFVKARKAFLKLSSHRLPQFGIEKIQNFETLLDLKYMKSVVDPGEAVGIVAGQSIGEPSTQMTLNTFHLAGHSAKNVTLGIPRLREIVMTASGKIATPTMTLYIDPDFSEEEGRKFAKGITRLTLAEVVDKAEVRETVASGQRIYDIRLKLFSAKEYTETYAIKVADVARALENNFVDILKKGVLKMLKLGKNDESLSMEIGKSVKAGRAEKASKSWCEDDENGETAEKAAEKDRTRENVDDEDEDDPDDDATQFKQKNRGANAVAYDAPDDDEQAIAAHARVESEEPELDPQVEDEGYGGSDRGSPAPRSEADDSADRRCKTYDKERNARAMKKHQNLADFTFDEENGSECRLTMAYDLSLPKILMLDQVELACRHAVIQAIPSLKLCTYVPEDKKMKRPHSVITEGVNFMAMQDYQHIIDPNSMTSNDIVAVKTHYGVEAARSTIIAEMDAVFSGHGISVNIRHLNLIADHMTRDGGFSPFSRLGMRNGTSPFAKMSFETTVGFLKDAVVEADFDDLASPSARIVAGRLSGVGTGSFEIFNEVKVKLKD